MNRFWACDCCSCSPNLQVGGVGFDLLFNPFGITLGRVGFGQMSVSCAQCTVYIVTFRFATEAIARQMVGEGNYQLFVNQATAETAWVTEEWVLFGDASSHSRDDARPVACSINTEVHPTFTDQLTPTSIDLNNGAFVWTRRSDDPDSIDFNKFDLTTGAEIAGGSGLQWCVGISARTIFARYFFPEGETPCMTIGFTGCDGFSSADLTTDTGCDGVDGWCWLSGLSYYDDSEPLCAKSASWFFPVSVGGGLCGEPSGATYDLYIVRGFDCEDIELDDCVLQFAWGDCTHDARECPEPSDLVEVFGGGAITSISCSSCGGSGGEDNCPPEDCPVQYCKWQWNVDTLTWDLLSDNCIAPSECPGPPADPGVTTEAWVSCNCCVTVTPGCTCDDPLVFEPCLTQDCTWIWLGTWDPLDPCSDITCECQGRPDDILDPGGFIGEIRDGCCCKEIV